MLGVWGVRLHTGVSRGGVVAGGAAAAPHVWEHRPAALARSRARARVRALNCGAFQGGHKPVFAGRRPCSAARVRARARPRPPRLRLVAEEADDGEAALAKLVLQRLQLGVLRREAARGREVHDEHGWGGGVAVAVLAVGRPVFKHICIISGGRIRCARRARQPPCPPWRLRGRLARVCAWASVAAGPRCVPPRVSRCKRLPLRLAAQCARSPAACLAPTHAQPHTRSAAGRRSAGARGLPGLRRPRVRQRRVHAGMGRACAARPRAGSSCQPRPAP